MSGSNNPLLVIPARLDSTRLPRKPLADISGKPMIVRVYERCMESGAGPVLVACDGEEIASVITSAGGVASMTDPELPSGSDRAYAAVSSYDPENQYDVILCVQGDLPTIDPAILPMVLRPLENPEVDVATLATVIQDEDEMQNTNVVKIALSGDLSNHVGRALYFSRQPIPDGKGPRYHHIGIYAWRRKALQRFVSLSPSPLERQERLEQLRALEDGMRIEVALVDTFPLGVDTMEELLKARDYYANLS